MVWQVPVFVVTAPLLLAVVVVVVVVVVALKVWLVVDCGWLCWWRWFVAGSRDGSWRPLIACP